MIVSDALHPLAAHADDGLHYFEGLKEAGRALAAHASLTATVLSGEANTAYFDQKIKDAKAKGTANPV